MSQRKPNNSRARLDRFVGSVLRQYRVAVVNLDPDHRQGLMNWRTAANIAPSKQISSAVCDHAHRWSIYISAFCRDQSGLRYSKSVEVAPQGIYLAAQLSDVIEACYRGLLAECNPKHLIGSGWIAIPDAVELDEAQAERVFSAAGAWAQQQRVA